MAKLIVSTWSCAGQLRAQAVQDRIRSLAVALDACNAAVAAAGHGPDGLVKGIFAAPEYMISRQYAGFDLASGGQVAFTVDMGTHDIVVNQLIALSRQYPRILFLPGSIAWEQPLSLATLERHMAYYAKRIPHYNLMPEPQLLAAIKARFSVSLLSRRIVTDRDCKKYLKDYGRTLPTKPLTDSVIRKMREKDSRFYLFMVAYALEPHGGYLGLADAAEKSRNRQGGGANTMMFNTAYALLNGRIVGTYHKQGNFNEEQGHANIAFVPGAAKGIFDFEGYRCGLEVCLDHDIGTLQQQLRGGLLDLQIVMSAWVQYAAHHMVVREGGYFVHASTEPTVNGVWQNTATGLQAAPVAGTNMVAGYPVTHFSVNLKNRQTYSLADTFMADLPGREPGVRPAKRWAPVQTPAKPFRNR